MHRPGTNTDDVQPSDILCDFCERPWGDEIPLVEGHQGSCICGNCLTVAWNAVIQAGLNDAPADSEADPWTCTMCLENRKDPAFRSPARQEAIICRRCIRLSARALDTDTDHAWSKPLDDA